MMAPHTDPPREPSPAAAANRNEMLDGLQRETFSYFTHKSNPANGLIADTTEDGAPASIAAVGLGLTAFPIGVERGFITREDAVQRALATCRFFWKSPHGTSPDAIGHKGFYYHFLDMQTCRRARRSELSSIDTTFLLGGMLTAAQYFNADTAEEGEIRQLAADLFARVDWRWMLDGGPDGLRRLRRPLLGHHGKCWTRTNHAQGGGDRASLLWLRGTRGSVWSGRWHHSSVGSRGVPAIRPGDRVAHHRSSESPATASRESVRVHDVVQSDVPR